MTRDSASGEMGRRDLFSIEIAFKHPTSDPQSITELLSIQPMYCWRAGDRFANIVKPSTYWYGRLSSGSTETEFANSLEHLADFLAKNEAFFHGFKDVKGEAEVVLNHRVELMEGKVFELRLGAILVAQLADAGIGVRVQGWS